MSLSSVPCISLITEKNLRVRAISLLLSCALAQGAAASVDADLSESDFLADVPVVLTASRLRQNVSDAPAAVTIIDRQMIRDSGAWSIPDLFRLVPGMYVGESADRGFLVPNTAVSYHGMTDGFSRRMQVLVDGRSIYTPLFGGAFWSTLPLTLDEIERIEVIRGPNSAAYGANSFLGVINIISRHAAETQGGLLSVTESRRGSDGTMRWGGRNGSFDYRVTANLRQDNGIMEQAKPEGQNISVARRFDNKTLRNFSFRGDLQIDHRDVLEVQAGLSDSDQQSGHMQANTFSPEHVRQMESYYGMLRWQRSLSADEQVSVKAYANRDVQNFDLSDLITLRPPLVVPYPYTKPLQLVGERYDLEAQHIFAPSATTRVVWGGAMRLDRFTSRLYFNTDNPVSFRQTNLFGNLEWRPSSRWVVNGGLMIENNSYTGTYTSPRLAVNYHVAPGHTLRLSSSRAVHTPVMLEARADSRWTFPLNKALCLPSCVYRYAYHRNDLQSEVIRSREIGYVIAVPGGNLDFKYSDDSLTQLLEARQVVYPGSLFNTAGTEFFNAGEARVKALEGQWQQKFGPATRLHVGWAMTQIAGTSPNKNTNYAGAAPLHSRNMLLAHDFSAAWTGSVAYYQVGRLTVQGDGDYQKPYERLDGRLAWRFRDGRYQGEVAVVVQNLLDRPYKEVYFENLIGRRSYVNLRLEF